MWCDQDKMKIILGVSPFLFLCFETINLFFLSLFQIAYEVFIRVIRL